MTIPVSLSPVGDEEGNDLLMRYWLGETSAEERAGIEAWFAKYPQERERCAQLYHGLTQTEWVPLSVDVSATRTERILQAAGAQKTGTQQRETLRRIRHRRPAGRSGYSLMGIGVAILFLIAAGAWSGIQRAVSKNARMIERREHYSTFATSNAERATVTLQDGSVIVLNVGSRLEVPADYGVGNRTVRLRGEALFRVAAHTGVPFTVIAGPSVTRVLGTQFLARYYDNDTAAVVAVRDGKVSVHSSVLTAMQQITVGQTGAIRISPATFGQFTFADGILTLSEQPLSEAIAVLNRWYDADIRLGDSSMGLHRIKGEFSSGSLIELMELLELTIDVKVVREGRVLTLYSR